MSQAPNILALTSAVFGLIFLIISSILVDAIRPSYDVCGQAIIQAFASPICDEIDLIMSAPAIGIVASLLQLFASGLAYLKKWQLWNILHGLVLILCIVGFGIGVYENFLASTSAGKYKAFAVFAIIDAIFVVVAAFGIFKTTKGV